MENRTKITAENIETLIRDNSGPGNENSKPENVEEFEISADCENFDFSALGCFLSNCKAAKFSGSRIPRLRDLGVSWMNIEILYLHRCGLKDISGVSALPRLRMLFAAFNEVEDLNALGVSTHLEVLDFENNKVKAVNNIQCLKQCKHLSHLTLLGNTIANLVQYRRLLGSLLAQSLECLDDEELTKEEREPVTDESEAFLVNVEAVHQAEVDRVVEKAIKLSEASRSSCLTPLAKMTGNKYSNTPKRPRTALGIRRPSTHRRSLRCRHQKHKLPPRPNTATPTRRRKPAWMKYKMPENFSNALPNELVRKDPSSALTFGSTDEPFRGSPIVALRRRRRKMKEKNNKCKDV